MEVKITVNGQEQGIFFGYTAYKKLLTAFATNPEVFMNDEGHLTDSGIVEVVFTAHENYCVNNRVKMGLTRDDIARWMDQALSEEGGKKTVNDLLQAWTDSKEIKEFIDSAQKKSEMTLEPPTSTS